MHRRLADENVRRLLLKLSLPAVTGMLVMALYNIVDTIFVGRWVGTMAIAGLSIVFPIQMVVLSVGLLFGIGGASVISRLLGAGNTSEAEKAYGTVAFSAVSAGLLLTLIGLVFKTGILRLFGASEGIMPYSSDYYGVIIFASPLFVCAMSGNNILRSAGMARASMYSMVIGAASNIVLDPVFIFILGMGVKGAAIATVLAQAIALVYLFRQLRGSKSGLHLRRENLIPNPGIFRKVTTIGFSSFVRHMAGSFVFAMVNTRLLVYGTEVSVAAYGIVMRLSRFLILPLIGISQGLQPIAGFNFGGGKYLKVREVCLVAFKWTTAAAIGGFILIQIFPEQLMRIFTSDPSLITAGKTALRLMMLGLWTVGFQITGTTVFQALGKAGEALILSMSREILFFIPLLIIMSGEFGLTGIWLTVPAADILAFTVTLILILRLRKKYSLLLSDLSGEAVEDHLSN